MSLYDWFFPQATAKSTELRRIAAQNRRHRQMREQPSRRIYELEENVGFIALLLGSLLDRLDKQGLLSREDLHEAMSELDALDGVLDGRLDVNLLRDRHFQEEVLHIIDVPAEAASSEKARQSEGIKAEPVAPAAAGDRGKDSPQASTKIEKLQSYLEELRQRRKLSDSTGDVDR